MLDIAAAAAAAADDDDDDDESHSSGQTIRRRHSPSPVERTEIELWRAVFRVIWWMIIKTCQPEYTPWN